MLSANFDDLYAEEVTILNNLQETIYIVEVFVQV